VVFGKNCKKAFKPFRERTFTLGNDVLRAMEAVAYAEATMFFRAFSSEGTATVVRQHMEGQ
jgi:hypothetical protein